MHRRIQFTLMKGVVFSCNEFIVIPFPRYQIDCPLSENIGELKKLGCEGETMDFVLLVDVTVTERVHGYCW